MGEMHMNETLDTISLLTQDPDERIRDASLRALFAIDAPRAVELAMGMISDASAMVSEVAVEVIGSGSTDPEATVRQLIGTFRGRPGLRLQAIRALKRFAGSPVLSAFVREAFSVQDPIPFGDVAIASEALEILAQKPSKDDVAALRSWLEGRSAKKLLRRKGPEKQIQSAVESVLSGIDKKAGG
jgi:HEAT repeat protein